MVPASSVADVQRAARGLRDVLSSFDPALVSGDECAAVVRELAVAAKACTAAKGRAAVRAGECGAHEAEGFADVADWLARHSGTTRGWARRELNTAKDLDACPATADAVRAGLLSLDEAKEITKAEKEHPGSEAELLELALRSGLSRLREQARKRRLEGIDPDELHDRQQAARRHRWWINDLGNVAYNGEIPPEFGIPIMNRLDAEADRIRREAKRAAKRNGGTVEAREAYAADAFIKMMTATGTALSPTRADVVFVVDLFAYWRGHAHPGEACHVQGGGPVPVHVVREIAKDAFLKVAFHTGNNVHTISHLGRHIPAHLRTALELGEPPDFAGVTCADEGCERRHGLQWDHVDPVANQGPTSAANLEARCWPHHQRKTKRDRKAGLLKNGRGDPERGPP